jgi:hypothetical protein
MATRAWPTARRLCTTLDAEDYKAHVRVLMTTMTAIGTEMLSNAGTVKDVGLAYHPPGRLTGQINPS